MTLELYGIDFMKELNNGRMGNLIIVDDNGIEKYISKGRKRVKVENEG